MALKEYLQTGTQVPPLDSIEFDWQNDTSPKNDPRSSSQRLNRLSPIARLRHSAFVIRHCHVRLLTSAATSFLWRRFGFLGEHAFDGAEPMNQKSRHRCRFAT